MIFGGDLKSKQRSTSGALSDIATPNNEEDFDLQSANVFIDNMSEDSFISKVIMRYGEEKMPKSPTDGYQIRVISPKATLRAKEEQQAFKRRAPKPQSMRTRIVYSQGDVDSLNIIRLRGAEIPSKRNSHLETSLGILCPDRTINEKSKEQSSNYCHPKEPLGSGFIELIGDSSLKKQNPKKVLIRNFSSIIYN